MGATWHERLENCRAAIDALEHAEADVDRAYQWEDRVLLDVAEREWNERRIEAIRRIRETFAALELAHELTLEQMEAQLPELKKLRETLSAKPPIATVHLPRPFNAEIVCAIVIVGIFVACLYRFGVW